jgi:predicted dienelactone hydrolase
MSAPSISGLRALPYVLALIGLAMLHTAAQATEAGFRQLTVAANGTEDKPGHAALYYPTADAARVIPMGPFPQNVAINGAPAQQFKGLIVISHGTVSTLIGFATLAQALARNGYLVAAVEHVGDTWQDQSLRATPARYFAERPRQVSRVIDTVLADPQWRTRIATSADGHPLIGAVGHSAGGYTVLALAGGKPCSRSCASIARLKRRRIPCCATCRMPWAAARRRPTLPPKERKNPFSPTRAYAL